MPRPGDANGNLTSDGTWAFAYDAENRLRTAAKSGTSASYQYDPLGRRQAKVANGVTTSFLSDGDEEIAEYTGAGGLLRRYVPGPATDQPIAMVTPSGGSNLHSWFHANRQGSTVAMSSDAGTVSEGPYTYDAYGQGAPLTPRPLARARGVRSSNRHCRWRFVSLRSTGSHPFKYTGRRLDAETGLYYYRARYYSASLGRFLQTDPIGYRDQMNLYGYVGNDPGNAMDPSGLYGRGSGWTQKDWDKFAKAQTQAAKDMRKGAQKLRDRSRSTRMPRERAIQKEMADNLDKGAAMLENDGSDGKTLANSVSAGGMVAMGNRPDAAAAAPRFGTTMNINRDHRIWIDNTEGSDFERQWAVGHESLHSVGLEDLLYGGVKAYRLAPRGSSYRRAFDYYTGTADSSKNPDHMMCEVYCDRLDPNW